MARPIETMYVIRLTIDSMIKSAIWDSIGLMQFQALSVPLPLSHLHSEMVTPNQLLVSHPIQFPPTCEFGFFNFSEPACSVKHALSYAV